MKCSGCKQPVTDEELQEFKTCKRCRDRQQFLRSLPEQQEYKKNYYQANKEKVTSYGLDYRRTPVARYKKLKRASVQERNIDFDISFDEYLLEISKPCFYCKGFFGNFKAGGGLDRIDNMKGYIVGNIISCCKICNRLKNDEFSLDETKAAVEAIIKIRENKNV